MNIKRFEQLKIIEESITDTIEKGIGRAIIFSKNKESEMILYLGQKQREALYSRYNGRHIQSATKVEDRFYGWPIVYVCNADYCRFI